MSLLSSILVKSHKNAEDHNTNNIISALKQAAPLQTLLDVGCWDGTNTLKWAKAAGAKHVIGFDAVKSVIPQASKNGIQASQLFADQQVWPLKPATIDCVVSNQVIEHLTDVDFFITQAFRVLKPGGIYITSTNNLSSWHNVFSLIFGWAPFDLANSSKKSWCIGNPLSLHQNESDTRGGTWTHKCIYTDRWLTEWFELYGFKHLKTYTAGYYPLPEFLSEIDGRHCAFITLCFKKP